MKIDLRSDTFTKPSAHMLQVMMEAEVGDDVFGEDPSVNELQSYCATLFGMDAALYCPTGTMANQIAIKCHTQPADELICDKQSHIYIYEAGGIAFNSGVQVKPISGLRGQITADEITEYINPVDVHKAHTSLVCLENTSNKGGGSCYDFAEILNIKALCQANQLGLHLDGARLFNALVATNQTALVYGQAFDSISICLSKGLGAPMGSVLLGSRSFIAKATRVRKVLGGGMRQAGYMAAAGLFALHNNVHRLSTDHYHAKQIAAQLLDKEFVGKMLPVDTNIIIFEILSDGGAAAFCERLKAYDVYCLPTSPTMVRMVTHYDVSEQMVDKLLGIIADM